MVSDSFVVSRAELACLALILDEPSLLHMDGGVGLLHVSADLDGARVALAAQGVITNPPDPAQLPLVLGDAPLVLALRLFKEADQRIDVTVDVHQAERRRHLVAKGREMAVAVSPTPLGPEFSFTVDVISLEDAMVRVLSLTSLAEVDSHGSVSLQDGPRLTVSEPTVGELRRLIDDAREDEAVELLCTLGWDEASARTLSTDLNRSPHACEIRSVWRQGSVMTIDTLSWLTSSSDSWWRFETETGNQEISFLRSNVGDVTARAANLLGMSS